MRKLQSALLAAVAAVLLVSTSAADTGSKPTIKPPTGWESVPLKGSSAAAQGYVLAEWFSYDRGHEESIELGRRPSMGLSDQNFATYYRAELAKDGQKVLSFRKVQLCKGEMGWFVKKIWAKYPNEPYNEDVVFVDGAYFYFASYHFPTALQPSAAAERSVESLCIPSPVIVKPLQLAVAFSPPPGFLMSDPSQWHLSAPPGLIAAYINPEHELDLLGIVQEEAPGESTAGIEQTRQKIAQEAVRRDEQHATVVSEEKVGIQTLCGGHIGYHFRYTEVFGKQRMIYDQITMVGPTLYSAIYIHAASAKPYQPAVDALTTLCPIEPSALPAATPTP